MNRSGPTLALPLLLLLVLGALLFLQRGPLMRYLKIERM